MKKIAICAALLSSTATPVWAQETAPQAEAASSEGLQDIVVTARRREERAQAVPIAITTLSSAALEQRSITGIKELQQYVPSLRVIQANNGASSSFYSLRGQTATDIRLNADLAVGVYIDGVYFPRAIGTDASQLIDIARVEVLKGPQGTLFGRNTTGGAINITTGAPTDKFEGMIRAKAGTYGEWGVSGLINVPISETLAGRFIASYSELNGYGRELLSGERLGRRSIPNVRGTIKWQPSSDFTVTLRGDYQQFHGTTLAVKPAVISASTSSTAVLEVIAERPGTTAAQAQALLASYIGGNPQDATTNVTPVEQTRSFGGSITLDAVLGEHLSARSITAYRGLTRRTSNDIDGTPFAIFNSALEYRARSDQFTQEFLLFGDAFDKRLDWTGGLYFGHERGYENGKAHTAAIRAPGSLTTTQGEIVNENFGTFFQATAHLAEVLSVTGGVRYTEDLRKLTSYNRNVATCLALGRSLASGPCMYIAPNLNTSKVNYTASVDLKPIAGVLLFARTSRGYRAGGQQITGGNGTSPAAAVASYVPFLPETVTDYEIGIKSDWFDRKLRINASVYTADYKSIQRTTPKVVDNGDGTTTTVSAISNVATGRIRGAELEVATTPFAGLELSGNAAYTSAKFTAGVAPGTPYPFVPEWTVGGTVAYTLQTSFGSLRTQADYYHQDAMITSGTLGLVPGYDVVNGRISAEIESANATVAVSAKNIFNKTYYAYATDLLSSQGYIPRVVAPPRTVTLEITKRF